MTPISRNLRGCSSTHLTAEGLQDNAAHNVGGILQGEEQRDVLGRKANAVKLPAVASWPARFLTGGGGGATHDERQGPGACVYVPDEQEGGRQPGESGRPVTQLKMQDKSFFFLFFF